MIDYLIKAKKDQNNRIKDYYRIIDLDLKDHMLLLSLSEDIRYYDKLIKFLEQKNAKSEIKKLTSML